MFKTTSLFPSAVVAIFVAAPVIKKTILIEFDV